MERQTEPQSGKGLEKSCSSKSFFSKWKKWGRELQREVQVHETQLHFQKARLLLTMSFKTPQVWLVFLLPPLSSLPSPTCVLFLFQAEMAYSAVSISFLSPTTTPFPNKSNYFHSSNPERTFFMIQLQPISVDIRCLKGKTASNSSDVINSTLCIVNIQLISINSSLM